MRFDIIGGGPAGLYLAYLLRHDNPAHRVRVFERNAANVTYGWGLFFPGAHWVLSPTDPSTCFNSSISSWNTGRI